MGMVLLVLRLRLLVVRPTTTERLANTSMSAGSRPRVAACWRMSDTSARVSALSDALTKMHSAWVAAKRLPRVDAPAYASVRQMVERRHAARKQVGGLVAEIAGHAKAHMPCDGGHGRDEQQRIVHRDLDCVDDRGRGAPLVDIVHTKDVGQENAVE